MQEAKSQHSVRLSVLLAAACAVFLLIGGAADAGQPMAPPLEHVVAPGDTLWAVAGDYSDPGDDLRRLVSDIKRLSGLESSLIHPGQVLLIPQG